MYSFIIGGARMKIKSEEIAKKTLEIIILPEEEADARVTSFLEKFFKALNKQNKTRQDISDIKRDFQLGVSMVYGCNVMRKIKEVDLKTYDAIISAYKKDGIYAKLDANAIARAVPEIRPYLKGEK
jgi:hypothetical protein